MTLGYISCMAEGLVAPGMREPRQNMPVLSTGAAHYH